MSNSRATPAEAGPKSPPPTARCQAGLMDLEESDTPMRWRATRPGMNRLGPSVVLTDGGNGLDEFMDVFFLPAVRILDFDRAAEHLGEPARTCGGDPEAIARLTEAWSPRVKHVRDAAVSRTPDGLDLKGCSPATIEEHRLVSGCVGKNPYWMDYSSYREQSRQIESGRIETACKTVANRRLKQSGCAGVATGPMRPAGFGRCAKAKPVSGTLSGSNPLTDERSNHQQRRRSPCLVHRNVWRSRKGAEPSLY